MADAARVTQAGRQSVTQIDGPARVTQAGRQTVTQLTGEGRVTQAGRQAASQFEGGTLRVSMLGRNVMVLELRPTTPNIDSPHSLGTYQGSLEIVHALSEDPIGGTTLHTFQYRKVGDPTWIVAFQDRAGNDLFLEDISALPDGSYEAQAFGVNTGGTGKTSAIAAATFTVDNSSPSAPVITEPVAGAEWIQGTNRIEWEAATDPQDDALTYTIDYRAVGAGSWTNITSGVTNLFYDWNTGALVADDYEIRVFANDGTNDGPAAEVTFSIVTADQPLTPIIRITEITTSCFTVEIKEYSHPTPRAWAKTTYEVIALDGDWSNPVTVYVTTDPAEMLGAKLCGYAQGFEGYVRVKFEDNAANVSFYSEPAPFVIDRQSGIYVQRWHTDAIWSASTKGELEAITHQNYPPPAVAQRDAAVVERDALSIGSAWVRGEVMEGGQHVGIGGLDTELRHMGIGLFEGFAVAGAGTWQGIAAYIDVGTRADGGVDGGRLNAALRIEAQFPGPEGMPPIHRSTHVDIGLIMIELIAGFTNVGPGKGLVWTWTTTKNRTVWYPIELLINRNVSASPSTRIRAKVHKPIGNYLEADDALELVAEDAWHIDVTYPLLGPCGIPGYVMGREGLPAPPTAKTYFRNLEYKALRDDGLPVPANVAQPTFTPVVESEECTPVAEAALPAPVFFPVPPNGNVVERTSTPADVITSWDDTEQRISLRERETMRVGWQCTLPTEREAGHLHGRLYAQQPARWGVPLWQDAAPLLVDLASSSGSIPAASLDTTDRRFDEMTHVALWVDQFTWHFSAATLEDDGSITLAVPTTQAFTGGTNGPTYVLPCRVGRMPQRLDAARAAPQIQNIDIEFILEGVN